MSRLRLPLGIACAFAAIFAAFLLWRIFAPPATFPPGKTIRFDDFDFTALTARERSPGEYVVRVKVANSARRVDFDFDPSVVQVSDGSGAVLRVAKSPSGETLAPGQTVETDFHLKGAKGLKEVHVRFVFGGSLGEFLDTVLLGKREVVLQVSH